MTAQSHVQESIAYATFTFRHVVCGAEVSVVDGVEQPHTCRIDLDAQRLAFHGQTHEPIELDPHEAPYIHLDVVRTFLVAIGLDPARVRDFRFEIHDGVRQLVATLYEADEAGTRLLSRDGQGVLTYEVRKNVGEPLRES